MKFTDYVSAAIRAWWIVLLALVLGLGAAIVVTASTEPVYQSTVKFYVVAPSTERQTALQSDELVRGRIPAYAALMTSEQFVQQIIGASGLELSANRVEQSISAVGDPDTLALSVKVKDTDPEVSLDIATQIADHFGKTVNDVESDSGVLASETILNVISGPTLSDGPVAPRWPLNLALGALLGLAAGLFFVIARHRSDKTIRSAAALDFNPELPLMATLPEERGAEKYQLGGRGHRASGFEERIRGLRTSVEFYPGVEPLQVIAVTSAVSGEGKTTTAMHLALAFSEARKRVLLVEADLRTPRLAERLKLNKTPGLVDALHDGVDVATLVQRFHELDILVAGSHLDQAPELLAGGRMKRTLDQLRGRYDIIVLDTTSLLSYADGALMCAVADGTIVVSCYGQTKSDQFAAAVRALSSVHATLLGTVFNKIPIGQTLATASPSQRENIRRGPGTAAPAAAPAPRTPRPAPPAPAEPPVLPIRPRGGVLASREPKD